MKFASYIVKPKAQNKTYWKHIDKDEWHIEYNVELKT